MNGMRACLIFAAAAVVTAAQAQDTYTIRRVLLEGEKSLYKLTTVSDLKLDLSSMGQGEIPVTMTNDMKVLFTVGKVDTEKSIADMVGSVSDFKMTMEPQMPGIPEAPSKFDFTGKLDSMGDLKNVELKGIDGMMKAMVGGSFEGTATGITFPEKALKIGDSWKMPATRKSSLATSENDITATLKSVKKVGDKDVFEITVKGKSKSTTEVKDETTGQDMKTTTNVTIDGTVLVDKATGAIVKFTVSGPIDINTAIGEMVIPMKGTYTSAMELIPAKTESVKAKE